MKYTERSGVYFMMPRGVLHYFECCFSRYSASGGQENQRGVSRVGFLVHHEMNIATNWTSWKTTSSIWQKYHQMRVIFVVVFQNYLSQSKYESTFSPVWKVGTSNLMSERQEDRPRRQTGRLTDRQKGKTTFQLSHQNKSYSECQQDVRKIVERQADRQMDRQTG